MDWLRVILAICILALYLGAAILVVAVAYFLFPPTTSDQYKEFGVRAGIALTVVSAFFGSVLAVFSLSTQIKSARDLEKQKEQWEHIKASLIRQTDLLSRTLDAKSIALDRLFVASNNIYRELEKLMQRQFDANAVQACERALSEAQGLAANLDDPAQQIVEDLVQIVFNIVGEVNRASGVDGKYPEIWTKYAKPFGDKVEELRALSLFRSRSTTINR